MFRGLLRPIQSAYGYLRLPGWAKSEHRLDSAGLPQADPGAERAVDEAAGWLGRAQDNSTTHDGGVARHYSLLTGWGPSYPETTGYIVPTMLAYAKLRGDEGARQRARRMLDWLVSIQMAEGGFQGGVIGAKPAVPVTFNTGQVLLGLSAGAQAFGAPYRESMSRAADWLLHTQDPDGCWRKHPSPFAAPVERTYDAHVAYGLFEAAGVEPGQGYAEAGLGNVRWALRHQRENGWFDRCCLVDPSQPLTHTLGYALRGVWEAFKFTAERYLLEACLKTAGGLLTAMGSEGFLPGRLRADWRGTDSWSCLTGTVQIAYVWLMLFQHTGQESFRDAACAANRYVRRTMKLGGPPESRGAIKGCFPVYGGYGRYEYLNWACKFFIDSNLLELSVVEGQGDVH